MTPGQRYAEAVASGDRDGLLAVLAPQLDFRAVTPSKTWAATTADEVADVVLGTWFFGNGRQVEAAEEIEISTVGDSERVGYRLRATTPDGPAVVEQQAYVDCDDDGRVTSLHIVCSGFHHTS